MSMVKRAFFDCISRPECQGCDEEPCLQCMSLQDTTDISIQMIGLEPDDQHESPMGRMAD